MQVSSLFPQGLPPTPVFVSSGLLLPSSSVSPLPLSGVHGVQLWSSFWWPVSVPQGSWRLFGAFRGGGGRTLDLYERLHADALFEGGFPSLFPRVPEDSRSSSLPDDRWSPFHLPLRRQRTSLNPDGARHSVLCAQEGRDTRTTESQKGLKGFPLAHSLSRYGCASTPDAAASLLKLLLVLGIRHALRGCFPHFKCS